MYMRTHYVLYYVSKLHMYNIEHVYINDHGTCICTCMHMYMYMYIAYVDTCICRCVWCTVYIYVPVVSLCIMGRKCFSMSPGEWTSATALRDSTALSRTTVSSTVARLSSGGWVCVYVCVCVCV